MMDLQKRKKEIAETLHWIPFNIPSDIFNTIITTTITQEKQMLSEERDKSDEVLKYTIINTHSKLKNNYKKIPFWSFISDITGKGSTRSIELCNYFGWNAHKDTDKINFYQDIKISKERK